MKKTLVFLAVLAVCFASMAGGTPYGEYTYNLNEGKRIGPINGVGPVLVEARADGTASIVLVSSVDGVGAAPNTTRRQWPESTWGDATFQLRADDARPFHTAGDKVDSVFVILGTATEVILTWTNEN